jgi:dihydrofolate synthase/folylpolyglutamate synthase
METRVRHPLLLRTRPQGIRLGLDRPRRLLAALGDPQNRFPSVLIAGTNGKGSTAALLDAVARAAGLSTGRFTSPALETDEDQIHLGGAPITPAHLDRLLERVLDASAESLEDDPTPFEALTAAAFLAFAEAEVELAVVECGMGGARDATNVADPEIAVLTTVGLEHRRFLGDTCEAVAREKAGIFRRDRPAVVGRLDREAHRAVAREAEARGAELHHIEEEVELSVELSAISGSGDEDPPGRARPVELTTPVRSYRLDLALSGEHQTWNLALAVRTAELLARRRGDEDGAGPGWGRLDREAVARGVAGCRVPGRSEWVTLRDGTREETRVLLDVAHNPQAVTALVSYLESRPETRGRAGWDLLFGVLDDKDVGAMLPPLLPGARRVVLTRPSDSRGRDPRELVAHLPAGLEAEVVPDPGAALERALGDGAGIVVVCGSMVLVGEVRRKLRRRYGGLTP